MSVQGRAPIKNYHQKAIPDSDEKKTALKVLSILDKYGNRAEYSDGMTNGEIRDLSHKSKEPMNIQQVQIGLGRLERLDGVEGDSRGYGYYRLTKPVDVLREEIQHPYQGLLKRVLGSIFILFGAGTILFGSLTLTGNIIASQYPIFNGGLILSFLLTLVGILLLFRG